MKRIGRVLAVSAASICALGTMTSCNKTGFKVGLLCLHGQTSTYDKNFIDAFNEACKDIELDPNQYEIRTSVAEDYNQIKSAAKEWAEDGYSMIFADSFGHQEAMRDMALKYPNTEFCHATGTLSTTLDPECKNFHTAFADIYKGRYLAGVVAGYKLAEKYTLNDNVTIGYVGAFPYAEVISGYTSFYLGVKKGFAMAHDNNKPDTDPNVASNITMNVTYTGSWYDYKAEKEKAESLISSGCVLISQHADSMGAPQACAAYGIPNVCYNVSTKNLTPNTYLVASKINWMPYFKKCIQKAQWNYSHEEGEADPGLEKDFSQGEIALFDDDKTTQNESSVRLLEYGDSVSEAAKNAVKALKDKLESGDLKVFDTKNFTISKSNNADYLGWNVKPTEEEPYEWGVYTEGESTDHATVTKYYADVIDEGDYLGDTQVVKKDEVKNITYFAESGVQDDLDLRSGPYFDLIIDGIKTIG